MSDEVIVERGVTYRQVGDTQLKLDLARPAGDGPFPAIAFIHGGGWHEGGRDDYEHDIEEAARRGYVAATISYRLMEFDEEEKETAAASPTFPAQVQDAKAAIRWLRANADQYHVDRERIGVTGASAGGHLSLLVGLTDDHPGSEDGADHGGYSSRAQAVVNVFGPTAMMECYETSAVAWIFRLFLDGTPEEAPAMYEEASPITYVRSDSPPVLTLHGDQDEIVPVGQAKLLDEKMNSAGASHELIVLEGQGHGFEGESQQRATQAMWDFFDKHLKA